MVDRMREIVGGRNKVVHIRKRHQALKTPYSHAVVSGFKSKSLRKGNERIVDSLDRERPSSQIAA